MSKNTHASPRLSLAWVYLLLLGALLLLAACGESTPSTNSTTTPTAVGSTATSGTDSTTPTSGPTPTVGKPTPTPRPTQTLVAQKPTPTLMAQKPTPTPVAQRPTPTPVAQKPTPTPTPQPTQVIATMLNYSFSPASLTIKVGTTVIWQNNSQLAHTVTAANGMFDSGNVLPGGTFSFKFTTAGSFDYGCKYHPSMTATIVVV